MFKQPEPEGAQNVHTNLKQEAGDRAKRGLAKPSQRSPVKKISTIIWREDWTCKRPKQKAISGPRPQSTAIYKGNEQGLQRRLGFFRTSKLPVADDTEAEAEGVFAAASNASMRFSSLVIWSGWVSRFSIACRSGNASMRFSSLVIWWSCSIIWSAMSLFCLSSIMIWLAWK